MIYLTNMPKSRETELREKFMKSERFKTVCYKLGLYESDARMEIADWWLNELSLALEEKVKEVEEKKNWYSGDGNRPIRDVIDKIIKILKS